MKKNKKKYSPKVFKEELPEWKRKKDPFTSRIFYRPVSFITASVATNIGLTANAVSYLSIILALIACVCFIIPNYICNIVGAILVNIWLISDCTDGNMARTVKKQPFGEFADGISSYILVGLLCTAFSISAYFNGGVLINKECIWIVLLGALASSSDTLMRLIYQKYKATERSLINEGKLKEEIEDRTDHSKSNSLKVRIESDFGIGGILPILVLLGTIFKALDLVVIYSFMYYFFSALLMILKYISKAIKKTKEIESKK